MTLKTDNAQIGVFATPSYNFVWNPDGAGSIKLQRGTAAAGVVTPIQDLMSFDAAGRLQTLGVPSAFSAHNNGVAQSIANTGNTTMVFSTERYDLNNDFASNAWTPPAGRPIVMSGAGSMLASGAGAYLISVFKNGAEFARGTRFDSSAGNITLVVTAHDIPNGTDVYTLRFAQSSASAINLDGGPANTYFMGARL